MAMLASATFAAASCGGSGELTTDDVTLCTSGECQGAPPAAQTYLCPDQSLAGPACIKELDGSCGWAVLSCGAKRGKGGTSGSGGKIGPGTGGTGGVPSTTGSGGSIDPYPATGGSGTGGYTPATGGRVGTGGYIGTGGSRIGTGGYVGTGGYAGYGGTGGYIGTGGYGGYGGTGGYIGTGGYAGGLGFQGSFSWSGQGQTFSSSGSYDENLALSGTAFIINISAASSPFFSVPCRLTGQFASVPPPPGTYPIGNALAPQVDGTFVGRCATYYGGIGDPSVSGTVVLGQSVPGDIEGSFAMHATSSLFDGTGGVSGAGAVSGTSPAGATTIIYTGAFAVGCRDNLPLTDPACAARSIAHD